MCTRVYRSVDELEKMKEKSWTVDIVRKYIATLTAVTYCYLLRNITDNKFTIHYFKQVNAS